MFWYPILFLLHVVFAKVTAERPFTSGEEQKKPKQWALLAAGSNGYDNYRHQADVCHAYQVLRKHGIPEERIVVMMYDDIANNSENPTKGEIVNRPNGTDVYKGVPKDYTGDAVTPHNFLSILQGRRPENGSGKIIESGPDDYVFVYFSDHGAPGMLIFPDSHLHARRLVDVITKMHIERKYGKMILFIEACFSGSMFETLLPNNISAYAMTAAHAHELSYACYYDKFRSTWLGDRFSVYWMEDADQQDLRSQTLHELYLVVRNKTTTSHVMHYGDMETEKLHLSKFMGGTYVPPVKLSNISCDEATSAEAPITVLEHKIKMAKNDTVKDAHKKQIEVLLEKRKNFTIVLEEIVRKLGANSSIITSKPARIDFPCYETAVDMFSEKCFKLSSNPYASLFLYSFVGLCNANNTAEKIGNAIDSVCAHLDLNDVV
ncbi:hypothetical protein HPB48_022687 [Haemaphysalis longicornis]|uniref:legumain n=1 Tax=Haemaphysalis longicornis TaxID=44386 RepID=A0A9J6G8P3_HAELO|nr:hypothetical protein HPB48_022687 [Haemaphysalis longicornis]